MIRDIWLRITAVVAFAVVPITLLQVRLQTDSLSLVYDLAERSDIRSTLDRYLAQLRQDASAMPEREGEFRRQFQDVAAVKLSVEEFFLTRPSMTKDILFQIVLITSIILAASLLVSWLISKSIVRKFQVLFDEREKARMKLQDLQFLKNWQNVARILVHELRAPITPIKLVATDLENKFRALDREAFAKYLADAQGLVAEQIRAIEAMMEGFTIFGRLPDPVLVPTALDTLIQEFVSVFGHSFGEGVSVATDCRAGGTSVLIDAKLMRDLLFNLCKNAAEANAGATRITLSTYAYDASAFVVIHNTGVSVPQKLKQTLFDPYVSTKVGSGSTNLGLGLTIARKVALDHGGDLVLLDEPKAPGVSFRVELPTVKEPRSQR